ncbi:hypothetical protein MTBBW1_850015 [Desulfamplus magnetovallimortis]|uniref:Uncharacterized protein n=1 Tax=Desulfamplus magnetovallimortis TaxID=1246637 RepID=A0A1W1HKI6_9BACT|nr:hypothetical protein MTBBW1_850015 [Desulfamplus magnetovallimortis]
MENGHKMSLTQFSKNYSLILNGLKGKGTPIPTNDIWIAAVALQHGLKLY